MEAASGFVVESKRFLLFPTYEHQSLENIKPQFAHLLKSAMSKKPTDGTNKITSYAEVISEADITSEEKINQLSRFHIWSDQYIRTRIGWMPDRAIKAVFLKTYKIPEFEIKTTPQFQGCKSWIDINANHISGKAVLPDSELHYKLERFEEIVN